MGHTLISNNDSASSKGYGREDTIAQTRSENVSKHSNDPLSGDDRLKLNELNELCTNLQQRVLDLETIKTAQGEEITSLKKRVKKLKRRKKLRTHRLQRLYKVGLTKRVESSKDEGLGEEDTSKQGRIDDIDVDQDIYLVNIYRDEDMFGVNDLYSDEVIVDDVNVVEEIVDVAKVNTAAPITYEEITLAQALMEIRSKGILVEEPMVEPVKLKRKEQIRIDEELALKLQAEEEEEERLLREKAQQIEKDNVAWDDVQAKIDADYELAQILQVEEQVMLIDAEKAK
ncbi:hypothetical protein Tco_0036323, partial [Tanacetum coccineum]